MTNQHVKTAKQPGLFVELLFNIVIPSLILMKLSGDSTLGPVNGLIVALLFPLGYGLWDLYQRRKVNMFSLLGLVSVLLTGGISLLELDPKYIAIKEAAIPGIIGLLTLLSIKTRYPVVKVFLYNDKLLKVDKIAAALRERGNELAFEKVLRQASYLVAFSFFVSSALNYVLAKLIMVSPPGTVEFNAELGKMTALSFPVIVLPAMIVMASALFFLFRRIRQLTELSIEEVINDGSPD